MSETEVRTQNTGNTIKGTLLLFAAALIWGTAFVAQRVGMDFVGPFTFTASRNLIGSAVLLPFVIWLRRRREQDSSRDRSQSDYHSITQGSGQGSLQDSAQGRLKDSTQGSHRNRMLLQGGIVCGVFLCIAANLQQIGILYTTVGKAGFITAMYIVIVPVFGIFLGKKNGAGIWISVVLAVAGLYLLSMKGSFSLERGDTYVLLCAFAFAFQISAIDYYVQRVSGVELACLEFLVCGILSAVAALITEEISWSTLVQAAVPILYAGVLSSGVAYTFQILGQKELSPALASLIMSFESVISALAGWLLLGQKLTLREIAGCAIIFAAILLAQMPHKSRQGLAGVQKAVGEQTST